jgi:hypothetical protein
VSAAGATRAELARPTSSAEYLVGEVKAHRRGLLLTLIGAAVVFALGVGLYKFVGRPGPTAPAPFQSMRMTRLPFNGKATSAVISPDGKRIASIAHGIETDRGFQNVVEVPVEGGAERPLSPKQ